MRNQKRSVISIVIALCMILGIFQAAVPAFAAEEVNLTILTEEGWSGSGYTVNSGWGQFEFKNYGGSDRAIYDKYDFSDDFYFQSKQLNIYSNTARVLFCYQDNNNTYKFTLGSKGATLVKVVNGAETVLATDEDALSGQEMSLKIDHAQDGTITVTRGGKGGDGTDTEIFSVNDTSLTHGKMGLDFSYAGGYFASMHFVGTAEEIIPEEPDPTATPDPTAAPQATSDPDVVLNTVYEQNFNMISDVEKDLWINVGKGDLQISDGNINGADWGENFPVMLYTGKKFDNETFVYGADLSQNWGGAAVNAGSIVFNYTAAKGANGADQKGYALEVQGGTGGTVVLKKFSNTLWNGVETLATYTHTESLQNKNVRAEVTYTAGGTISADIIVGGTRYHAFTVSDTTYASGYIGVMKSASGFAFDNVTVQQPDSGEPQPAEPTLAPDVDTSRAGYGDRTEISNVRPALPPGADVPSDWVAKNIVIASDWGAFREGSWGGSGYVYYQKYCMEGKFSYTVTLNNYSSGSTKTYVYIMFNDENNYYAAEFGDQASSPVRLIKRVNGVDTVLATSSLTLKMQENKPTVSYDHGKITVSVDGTTYISGVVDTSLVSGFVGIGYSGGGFHEYGNIISGTARPKLEEDQSVDGYIKNFSVNHRIDKSKIGYNLTIQNDGKENIFAAAGLFDSETNRVVAIKTMSSSDELFALDGDFEADTNKNYYAKAFVWDSAEKAKPLQEVKRVEFKKDEYKVLAIGNSFSQDAMGHLHRIAAADGVNMLTANLFIGGCSIDSHWSNAQENKSAYLYELNTAQVTGAYDTSIKQALQQENWDFVTIQQASPDSGKWETYSKAPDLAEYVKTYCPGAEVVIHQTWAYEKGSDHYAFSRYNSDQKLMFDGIKDANERAASAVSERLGVQVNIIPSGEAFQIARNSEIGGVKVFDTTYAGVTENDNNTLNRDSYHASMSYGRYLIGATWYEMLTGNAIENNSYRPSESKPTDAQLTLLKNAAHDAVELYKWFNLSLTKIHN